MQGKPVNLAAELGSFDDIYSPRIFVVPKGTEHKPSSPGGANLMFEPAGTSSTGDRHEGAVPDRVDSTTGHELG